MSAMNFLFRKPHFPLIIDTGYGLLGAKSWALCEKRLAKITFPDMAPRDVIDSSAEAFSLYPEHLVFSPLTFKKRWTKAAKALAAAGKPMEAIRYAEESKGLNAPLTAIAAFCEGVLLDSGFADEAYARYAIEATYATTNLATFKAIVKKYPHMPRETILRDLVASQPGNEGKWFAAAKDAGFFELAIELANRSPSDPRTLIRAARDSAVERPEFALAAGITALRGIANGWGYDITGVDVLDAYAAVMAAAGAAGVDETVVRADVQAIIEASRGGGEFVGSVLGRQLAD